MRNTHVPETFFGYDDIIWSAVPSKVWAHYFPNEPAVDHVILRAPGWLRHSSYGFGDTKAAATADLKKRRGQSLTRVQQKGKGAYSWTAYYDYEMPMQTGTWGEVRQFLRDAISNIGGTDHVFLETAEKEGEKDSLPIYSLGLGS